jgi:RNA polymerase sigma-70 factor (ECF subfamily)
VLPSGHRNQSEPEPTIMSARHKSNDLAAATWDKDHIATALTEARRHASRVARRRRLQPADRDELQQTILLAMVERAPRFDPAQSCWPAFVALLARHAVADLARSGMRHAPVVIVPFDMDAIDACPASRSATQPEPRDLALAIGMRLDLQRLLGDLPAAQRRTLGLLLAAEGDIAAAQRRSGRSSSAFYRDVQELRFWLRASGLVPPSQCGGKVTKARR